MTIPKSEFAPVVMTAFIAVEDVDVRVDGQRLLQPVSFTVERGEAIAVTGVNGSGKTTLLRVLAGVIKPTSGRTTVAGLLVDERDRRFRASVAALIGYPAIARDLTLEEHITLVAASWGEPVGSARLRAQELLDRFEISPLRQRFVHELSSGQTQLFSLALTVARPFDVLLLDEPEQRLDDDHLELVASLLRNLVDGGTTLLFASHNRSLINTVSDRALALGQ